MRNWTAIPLVLLILPVAMGCGEGDRSDRNGSRDVFPSQRSTDRATSRVEGWDESHPQGTRVVSLTPRASRFLHAIGATHRLVGIDAASRSIAGLETLPETDLERAHDVLAADLILVEDIPLDDAIERQLASEGTRVVAFAPHDLEEVTALLRTIGAQLVGEAQANAFEQALSRPLALYAGRAPPGDAPKVLALVGVEPLELAGGHSFESDLIQIAGGTSMTHGGTETRLPTSVEGIRARSPDVVVVMLEDSSASSIAEWLRQSLSSATRVETLEFDRERFWLGRSLEDARKMRRLLFPAVAEDSRS